MKAKQQERVPIHQPSYEVEGGNDTILPRIAIAVQPNYGSINIGFRSTARDTDLYFDFDFTSKSDL